MACAWLLEADAAGDTMADAGGAAVGDAGGAAAREAGGDAAPGGSPVPPIPPGLAGSVDVGRWEMVARLAASGLRSPATTSVGRLFDAVAALCGLRARVTYEGQAAIELEMAASAADGEAADDAAAGSGAPGGATAGSRAAAVEGPGPYDMPLLERPGRPAVLDARPAVRAVRRDLEAGTSRGTVAHRFHLGLADSTALAARRLAEATRVGTIVLSGGVFQNVILLEAVADRLAGQGLRVLLPSRVPPNDGGISYGQAAVAAARS